MGGWLPAGKMALGLEVLHWGHITGLCNPKQGVRVPLPLQRRQGAALLGHREEFGLLNLGFAWVRGREAYAEGTERKQGITPVCAVQLPSAVGEDPDTRE